MAYVQPTIADFKSRFDRDFAYCGTDQTDLSKIRDKDITTAFTQQVANFNEGLFPSQALFSEASLLLAAHFLCVNILASSQGLGGSFQWLTQSKDAGGMSETFSIPARMLKSPFLASISKTIYGAQYLTIIDPLMVGNIQGIRGNTTP